MAAPGCATKQPVARYNISRDSHRKFPKVEIETAAANGAAADSLKRRLTDQCKKLIDRHFHAGYRQRKHPENDQNEAEKGPIMRPIRLMMDKSHSFPPKSDLASV
jgi:hypothetical protein